MKKNKITVEGREIAIRKVGSVEYVSLTDMVGDRSQAGGVIINWIRTIQTLEFLAAWERLFNTDFKVVEYHNFREQAGTVRLTLSPKQWIEETAAIGIISKPGRYGGTFAHPDIAFEFGGRISPTFKIMVIREYQQLKIQEMQRRVEGWDVRRMLTKVNYRLQTEAIKEAIIPRLQPGEINEALAYAGEADLLNLVLFGMTAKQWREQNPELKGNIREHATSAQLTVISNLEVLNSQYIRKGTSQEARYYALCDAAEFQLRILGEDDRLNMIE